MTAEIQPTSHELEAKQSGFRWVQHYFMSEGIAAEIEPQIAGFRNNETFGIDQREFFETAGLRVREFTTHFGREEALVYLPPQNMRERLIVAVRGVAGANLPVYVSDNLYLKNDKSGFEIYRGIGTSGNSERGLVKYGSWEFKEYKRVEGKLEELMGIGSRELQLSGSIQEMPSAPWDGIESAPDLGPGYYVDAWNKNGIALKRELPSLIEEYQNQIDIALGNPDEEGLVRLPLTPWTTVRAEAQDQSTGDYAELNVNRKIIAMPLNQAVSEAQYFMAQLRKLVDK